MWLLGSDGGAAAGDARGRSLELLAAFDEAWVTYLEQFAAWKLADAATLEVQLASTGTGVAALHCEAVLEVEFAIIVRLFPYKQSTHLSTKLALESSLCQRFN